MVLVKLEAFLYSLGDCLACLVTGAQDCHGGIVGSDVPLKIGEGDEGRGYLSEANCGLNVGLVHGGC